MKKIFILTVIMTMSLVFSLQAHSALQNLGTDSLGNRLIYDTDLDITWYDYTRSADLWQNQLNWADSLSVTFGGITYNDWRLPETIQPDPSCGGQFNPGGGFPIQGYGLNCTGSEMGHLYYTELGNSANGPLDYTGDFQHLQSVTYWSGTEYAPDTSEAWQFRMFNGTQRHKPKFSEYSSDFFAIAVRPGIAVVPEPISSILFLTGGATLGFRRFWKKRRTA